MRLSLRAWTFLTLAAAAVFTLVYLTPPNLFGSIDWVRIHVFYKHYAQDAVHEGRLPLWNPYVSLGRPFLADVDAATLFYPPNVPYLVLPPELACVLVGIGHTVLAAYGGLRLGQVLGIDRPLALGAGFVFVLSAPIVGSFSSGLIHYGPALCYLPLVFALVAELQDHETARMRRTLGLGLVLGLQLLAGHPQAAWITWIGSGVFLLLRTRAPLGDLVRLAGGVALAFLLAAVTLLPLAELTAQSNRGQPSLALAGAFAMPRFAWASLVVPSDPAFSFLANAQLYFGVAPLIAALLGLVTIRDRDVRALAGVAGVGALLAAGNATPVFKLFYVLVPGVSSLRLHSRATVLVSLCLLFVGARALSRRERPRAAFWTAVAIVAAAQLGFVLGWPGFAGDRALRLALRTALTVGSTVALFVYLKRPSRFASLTLCLVLVVDLGWAATGLKPQNRDVGDRPSEAAIQKTLLEAGAYTPDHVPPRVSVPRPYARENAGMLTGWSSYTGYAALSLDRVWHHVHAMLDLPVPTEQNTYVDRRVFHAGAFPFSTMSLRFGVDPQTRQGMMRLPDPRAYLVGAARRVADHREATRLMKAGHDVHRAALVEEAISLPGESPPIGSATIRSFAPERIEIEVDASAPGLLVLGEAWYPGWTATVNGSLAPCMPANAWMRAVPIPEGKSIVVLRFHSRYLRAGASISSLTALVVLVLLLRLRRGDLRASSVVTDRGSRNTLT